MTSLVVPTSEGVELRREIAGAGSRFAAGLLDGIVIALGYLSALLALLLPGLFDPTGISRVAQGLLLGGALLAVLAYHVLFHALAEGRTPGKRALGIRVLSVDGRPPSLLQVVIRALIWPIDVMFPVPLPVGLVVIAATSLHQRLGDLFAGTLVVRDESRSPAFEPFPGRTWSSLPSRTLALSPGAAARLDAEDRELLRDLIVRTDVSSTQRRELFVAAAKHYSAKLGLGPFEDARVVILELYLYAREHASRGG